MGKLQTGRFERLGARTYSIKGPGALVDLDETVLGVLQLERQAGMEAHWIQAWETFGTFFSVGAAGAGFFRWMALSNPPGSGRIAVVDWYQAGDANRVEVFISRGVPPGFAVVTVGDPLDTRIPTARQPSCTFQALGSLTGSFGTQIGVSASVEQQQLPIVLGEDGTLMFRTFASNQPFVFSLRWAERDSQPFER